MDNLSTTWTIIGALLLTGWFGACNRTPSPSGETVPLARVGSAYLTLDEAKKNISAFAFSQDSVKSIETYREQWIQNQVLLNEAENLQLTDQPEVQNRLQRARNEVLISALKDVILSRYTQQNQISDEEARQYYEQHRDQLVLNERYVKYRHVENENLAEIRQARTQLQNDSSWTHVAQTFSLKPQKKIEISSRFYPVSSVFNDLPVMKRYITSLDSSQISPIQRYQGIYHFIQLVDVREQGETAGADWFRDELKNWLRLEKQRKYYNSYVKNLYLEARENNEIELFNVN